jgi:hypothetical protein
MGNTWDFLGAYKNDFMKSSLDVYTNLSGNLQFVGKTQNEKTISPNTELVEWFDNTSGTQTLYALDIDKFDMSVAFSFMQLADPQALAIALNADLDTSHPTLNYLFLGSNPNSLPEAEWRLVGQAVDGRGFTIVIRRGIIIPTGDIALGAPGNYSEVPVTLRCLQDTTITNGKRDVAYIMIDKRTFS